MHARMSGAHCYGNWPDLCHGVALKASAAFFLVAMYAWSHEVSSRVADGNLVLLALACACACLGAALSSRVPTCLASALPVAA
ncbi:MAG: hypothetical protein ACUVWR_14730, partial [Anaerolineae bacterium]